MLTTLDSRARREPMTPTSLRTNDQAGVSLRAAAALLGAVAILLAPAARAAWETHAENPQHTGVSSVASQPLQVIRWSMPVDLAPPSGIISVHYGSPLVTAGNTVIVPVKTGSLGGYRVEARRALDGAVVWTANTDYILPPYNWMPSYAPTLTAGNRVYFAGAGGTLYYRDAVDSGGPEPIGRLAFYGLASYTAAPSTFNTTVFVNTPITVDDAGTIYFGFRTSGSAPLGLKSGIARIDVNGNGSWVSATAASGGDATITRVPHQAAPALSNDGHILYVVVASASSIGNSWLVGLDPVTLALKESSPGVKMRVALKDPRNGNNANVIDDSSGTPMVGPDGDVYYGVLGNPFNVRGWMLHFSGNLTQVKTPGAFGWDNTASVVPKSAVPSYNGGSSYLLFTKYNNYAGSDGGDGVNKLAVLDPNATMVEPHPSSNGQLVMKEVLTIAGVTPDADQIAQFPNAVREWCINTAAVDPFTKTVLVNSEDGKLYRWNLTTNTLSAGITLSPGVFEAYTPTVIGPDGTAYAINWSILNAVGALATPSPSPTATPTCIPGANNGISGQVRYYSNGLPVSGATVLLSGATSASVQTDATGQYAFTGLNGCSFHVEARKLGEENRGISALDATYTLQFVANMRPLDATQRLACDVTGNGAATTLDATNILQQRVGIISRFPVAQACASDWLFVPVPAAAPNQTVIQPQTMPAVNTCQPGAIELKPLTGQITNQDFAAVLVGDCTGNWQRATPTATPQAQ
jgi:hypothetical protein